MRIVIAGLLSFLATLTAAQLILYILWLVGKLDPQYQLITGIIAGLIGLFVGGWVTVRVMNSEDVWFSAFNGYFVGGVSAYFLWGLKLETLALSILSFVFAGMGGYAALKREPRKKKTELKNASFL
jgi:hypothetical protein